MFSFAPTSVFESSAPASVVALGCFDGLHQGHAALLRRAKEQADILGLPLVIYSPETKKGQALLFTPTEKERHLLAMGCERVILADFDHIRGMSATEFVDEILCRQLNCRIAVCGFNFRFGNKASGDSRTLVALMRERGRDALVQEPIYLQGAPVSSSRIRSLLAKAEPVQASVLMGRPYSVEGRVEHGRAIGRTMGFPTLNLAFPKEKLIPHTGVYYVRVHTDNGVYAAIANVGVRPTFSDRLSRPVLEAHLFDFSGNLYETEVSVEFCSFLRPEKTFSDPQELAAAVQKDMAICRALAASDPVLSKELS